MFSVRPVSEDGAGDARCRSGCGSRGSPAPRRTRENSSFVFRSYRNSVLRSASSSSVVACMMPREQQVEVQLAGEVVGHLQDAHLFPQAGQHQVEAPEELGVLVGRAELQVVVEIAVLDAAHRLGQPGRRARDLGGGEHRHGERPDHADQDHADRPRQDRHTSARGGRRRRGSASSRSTLKTMRAGEEQQGQRVEEDGQVEQLAAQPDRDDALLVLQLDALAVRPQPLDLAE